MRGFYAFVLRTSTTLLTSHFAQYLPGLVLTLQVVAMPQPIASYAILGLYHN